MSYDSINPMQVARMNKKIPFFNLKDGNLEVYNSVSEIPISIVHSIATNPEHVQIILEEIDRRNNGFRLQNAGSFEPFNVYSNLELDKFLKWSLKYDLVSVMKRSTSPTGLISCIGKVLDDLSRDYPRVLPVRYNNRSSKLLSVLGAGIIGLSTDAILKLRRSLC